MLRACLLPLFLTVGIAAAAEPLPTVAVLPFASQVLDSGALEGIGSAFGSELLNTGKVRVMERSQMSRILLEQGFQQSGACDGSECAVQVGRLLSVQSMVLGTVAKVGDTYTLTARLVDVGSGEVLASATRNSPAKADALLTDAVPATAKELSKSFSGKSEKASTTWWPWIAGGAAVVAVGATAAVLLTSSKGSSSTSDGGGHGGTVTSTSTDVQVMVP